MFSNIALSKKKKKSISTSSISNTIRSKVLPSFGKPLQMKGASEEEALQTHYRPGC